MAFIPAASYAPDVADYEGATSRNVLNVTPQGDGYGPFKSFAAYTTALPSACRGAFYALKSDGSIATFAGTTTKLYQLDNTDFTWTDVSLGAGSYTPVSNDGQWQFAQTGNLVFATHANVVLQVFDLSSDTAFSAALGSPPQAAYITVIGPFLVLSGLLSSPYRIQWSGLNSFNASDSWTAGINSSDFQDFPDGGIVRGVAGGDQSGVIFQDQIIRSMAYVAGSPIIFQIDKIAEGLGLLAPYSIIRAGGSIFFYAGQGFQMISPGAAPVPIGREKVDRTFLADLDSTNLQLFMGAADPRNSRIFWAYKSVSGAIGSYDKLLGYDTQLQRFFPVMMTGQYLLGISQSGTTLEALDDIAPDGSLDELILSLDDYPTSFEPQLGQFDSAEILGFFSGPALEATIDSAEQGAADQRITVRGFRPICDAPTLFGRILYRDTQQTASIVGNEVGVSVRTGRCDMMRDTRYVRFRNRIPAGTAWSFFAGVEPDASPGAIL